MKNLILLIVLFVSITTIQAQTKPNTVLTADGNYKAITKSTDSIKSTGKTYSVKDTTYTVYQTAKGRLFIKRISKKTSKEYKQYLKL